MADSRGPDQLDPAKYTEFDCTWNEVDPLSRFKHWRQLEDLLDRMTLPREGWTVEAEPWNGYVRFQGKVIDVDTGNPGTLTHRFAPPAWERWDPSWWAHWVVDRLMDIERHEICEEFMIDGVRVFRPHYAEGNGHYKILVHHEVDLASMLAKKPARASTRGTR